MRRMDRRVKIRGLLVPRTVRPAPVTGGHRTPHAQRSGQGVGGERRLREVGDRVSWPCCASREVAKDALIARLRLRARLGTRTFYAAGSRPAPIELGDCSRQSCSSSWPITRCQIDARRQVDSGAALLRRPQRGRSVALRARRPAAIVGVAPSSATSPSTRSSPEEPALGAHQRSCAWSEAVALGGAIQPGPDPRLRRRSRIGYATSHQGRTRSTSDRRPATNAMWRDRRWGIQAGQFVLELRGLAQREQASGHAGRRRRRPGCNPARRRRAGRWSRPG